jgi:hypothetical protein
MKRLLAVPILTVTLIAGCSATASPPPTTRSLAQDQNAVNDWQAVVKADNSRVVNDLVDDGGLGQRLCAIPSANCPNGVYVSTTTQDEAKLKSDQFKLQVAEDQLTKDEG